MTRPCLESQDGPESSPPPNKLWSHGTSLWAEAAGRPMCYSSLTARAEWLLHARQTAPAPRPQGRRLGPQPHTLPATLPALPGMRAPGPGRASGHPLAPFRVSRPSEGAPHT